MDNGHACWAVVAHGADIRERRTGHDKFGRDSITATVTVPGHGDHAATFVGSEPTDDIALIKLTGLGDLPTTAEDETGSNEETLLGLLQTDAPISPGNSAEGP